MSMFCYQCEQTAKGAGCWAAGVCGKNAETAALQDLLLHAAKGVSQFARRLRDLGEETRDADIFVTDALFTTVTNVNFDPERLEKLLLQAAALLSALKNLWEEAARNAGREADQPIGPAEWKPAAGISGLIEQGLTVSIERRIEQFGADLAGLQELLTYGLKGTAAYCVHARILGKESGDVYSFFHAALDYLAGEPPEQQRLLELCLKCGEMNLHVMEMLDQAHTSTFGHPQPTKVRVSAVKGKAILVSGHDLKDLEELLEQTEGTGINVYTHGEMLPAHGYPELRKHRHLAGNYGSAWQNQWEEFDRFPGSILMTTNCIQRPKDAYKKRIFTSGLVAWPGVTHISDHNFTPVIDAALAAEGFKEDEAEASITVGFGHQAVLNQAEKVVAAVKSGAIKHFFLIGGCDGAKPGRGYYSDFARSVPDNCLIMTLACGKYRFNKLDFGEIGGIPRLLDLGQCNDAYSAIKIASALAGAFGCGVNDLPLSLVLSWYEQKAVAILLTLLHLGIRNIRLGPTLPAFVSPAVLGLLSEKFDLKPIKSAAEDLQACLA